MNILVINGSPKGNRSNTMKVTNAFVSGLNFNNNSKIDVINLSNSNLKHCLGCFSCWKVTPGKCVIKDDMNNYLELFKNADYIIYSFPLYYFSVPGLMKDFIDRELPLNLPFMVENKGGVGLGAHPSRYDKSHQKFILISTCGFYTSRQNYDAVISMFNHICGKDNYLKLFVGQGELFNIPELKDRTDLYLSDVKNAGTEFITTNNVSKDLLDKLSVDFYPKEVYEKWADDSWGVSKDDENQKNDADSALIFTKQMANLYNKNNYPNKDLVIEMRYSDINKNYQIILTKDGPIVKKDEFSKPDTIITTPITVWKDIASKKYSGDGALFKGLYKVEGDFNTMINWNKYFGFNNSTIKNIEANKKESKTSMLNFLIPFIINFIALPIDNYYGAIASISLIAVFYLIMFKTKKIIYDYISLCFNICFALISLVFLDKAAIYINSIPYLMFGLCWLISIFFKLSLSAYYSINNYDETYYNNPLFLVTNKIISLMWGIYYIITFVFTLLMNIYLPSFELYLIIINNVEPIILGFVTKWLISFYPRHLAKGKKKKEK